MTVCSKSSGVWGRCKIKAHWTFAQTNLPDAAEVFGVVCDSSRAWKGWGGWSVLCVQRRAERRLICVLRAERSSYSLSLLTMPSTRLLQRVCVCRVAGAGMGPTGKQQTRRRQIQIQTRPKRRATANRSVKLSFFSKTLAFVFLVAGSLDFHTEAELMDAWSKLAGG